MRRMPLSNGATFAGYEIVRPLGAGGMGEVYLARHPRLPREDALKILPAEVSADPEFRHRFNREADLASTLYHPHIVGVHDRGEFEGQLWIAMDFVDGPDTSRLLRERHKAGMPGHEVDKIVNAVAEALDYAHKRGMLHRDVKPANILLTDPESDAERILLADFGIARRLDDVSGLTATNMMIGTVHYSAPEQLMGHDLDGRTDQYALAATAFHLLTGAPPYDHSNPAVVMSRHIGSELPALAAMRSSLAELDPVMARAMAKRPADRYDTCTAFAKALAQSLVVDADSLEPPVGQAHATVVARPHFVEAPFVAALPGPLPGPRMEPAAEDASEAGDVAPLPERAEKFVDQRDMPPVRLKTVLLALLVLLVIVVATPTYLQHVRSQRSSSAPARDVDGRPTSSADSAPNAPKVRLLYAFASNPMNERALGAPASTTARPTSGTS
jgi:serine/threonine protein kinase